MIFSCSFSCYLLQCCAVAFIEKLDAQSLNLSAEEFKCFMSGQASPQSNICDADWPQTGSVVSAITTAANPVLSQLSHNLEMLSGLNSRQEMLMEAAQSLQASLFSWPEGVQEEVNNVLHKYPLEILPRMVSAIDANNIDNDNLPPPLTPQVFAG